MKYILTEKNENSFELVPSKHRIDTLNFSPNSYLTQKDEILFFEIDNDAIQTQIDLTQFSDYLLIGFEPIGNKLVMKSVVYSSKSTHANYSILTTYKKLLCIPLSANYIVSNWDYLTFFDSNALSTWSYELANQQEDFFFSYYYLSTFNLVIKLSSVESPHLMEIVSTFYELNNFDRDILVLGNNYSRHRLYEIVNEILIPNGLKEKEDFCLLEDYVVDKRFEYTQHPDCIDVPWLSGYLHPANVDWNEGNYIHFCSNPLTKRIVFMFYKYMKKNHYHVYKYGLKVLLIKDGHLYFSLDNHSYYEAKIPLLCIINDSYSAYENASTFEHLHHADLIKWKLYCSILKDDELIEFYNFEIHKMRVKENGRYLYINALKTEIKSRSFDSSVLDFITEAGIGDDLFYKKLKINELNVLVLKEIYQQ